LTGSTGLPRYGHETKFAGLTAHLRTGEKIAMTTISRRQAIGVIGTGIGTSLASGIVPGPLLAQTRDRIAIGTAGKGGVFYPLGNGLATVISKYAPGIEATALVTSGAAENMKLLHEGKIEVALAQSDVSWAASQGQLKALPDKVPVRTLIGTTSGYLHIVTLEGLGIETAAGLKGKRVSTGETGSGTEVKTLRVLEAHGVTPDNLGTHAHQDYPEAAQALKEGKLDAFAWDATLPGKAIVDLAATPGIKIRLLDTGDAVPKMVTKYGPFYFAAPIPKGTYQGVSQDVSSAVGKTLFVSHERMAEALAYEITKALLDHTAELTAAFAAAKEITPTNAVLGSSVPFHPGALRYYKEKGIAVPVN
jgi:TRAP transporter TAXI family solute receptor